jgi:hypothetical protein
MHACAAAAIVTNSEPKPSLYYTESPNGYLRQAPNGVRPVPCALHGIPACVSRPSLRSRQPSGRGFCLGAEKTRSRASRNACRRYMLCWAVVLPTNRTVLFYPLSFVIIITCNINLSCPLIRCIQDASSIFRIIQLIAHCDMKIPTLLANIAYRESTRCRQHPR